MCANPDDDALTRLRRQAAILPDFQVPCRGRHRDGSLAADDWYSKHRVVLLRAQRRCSLCPLLLLCREAARENNEQYGVWGGETPGERRRALRKINAVPTPRKDTTDGKVQAAQETA